MDDSVDNLSEFGRSGSTRAEMSCGCHGETQRLRIASYNINGINSRLPVLLRWLDEFQPDIVGLQELKCTDEAFPRRRSRRSAIRRSGTARRAGTASPSSAASASRSRPGAACPAIPTSSQSRYIEAAVCGILIGNLYLPNGNPWPGPKFDYKLAWMDRLHEHAQAAARQRRAGAADRRLQRHPDRPGRLQARALGEGRACSRRKREAKFAELVAQGWTDAIRTLHPTSASTPSGITGGTRSSATPASASTMPC